MKIAVPVVCRASVIRPRRRTESALSTVRRTELEIREIPASAVTGDVRLPDGGKVLAVSAAGEVWCPIEVWDADADGFMPVTAEWARDRWSTSVGEDFASGVASLDFGPTLSHAMGVEPGSRTVRDAVVDPAAAGRVVDDGSIAAGEAAARLEDDLAFVDGRLHSKGLRLVAEIRPSLDALRISFPRAVDARSLKGRMTDVRILAAARAAGYAVDADFEVAGDFADASPLVAGEVRDHVVGIVMAFLAAPSSEELRKAALGTETVDLDDGSIDGMLENLAAHAGDVRTPGAFAFGARSPEESLAHLGILARLATRLKVDPASPAPGPV